MPDQELIKYIMLKHFSDLQIAVSFRVIEYAANFLPKDYRVIKDFICHIDNLALSLKREITLPLIKQYFLLDDEQHP
jgi:chromosomal replication initiation ATPase DnaA